MKIKGGLNKMSGKTEMKVKEPQDGIAESDDLRDVDGSKLSFYIRGVGPCSYFGLRGENYGPEGAGFVQPTFGELMPLIYFAWKNSAWRGRAIDRTNAKPVVRALAHGGLAGRTIALVGSRGLFADDNPNLDLIRDLQEYETILEKRLGSKEENGVVYSDDMSIRFTPRVKKLREIFTNSPTSSGVITLVGNEEREKMLYAVSGNVVGRPIDNYEFCFGDEFLRTRKLKLIVPIISIEIIKYDAAGFREKIQSTSITGEELRSGGYYSFGMRRDD